MSRQGRTGVERYQSPEEVALRRYFAPIPQPPPDESRRLGIQVAAALSLLFGVFLFFGSDEPAVRWLMTPVILIVATTVGSWNAILLAAGRSEYQRALKDVFPRPSAADTQRLLEDRKRKLIRHSRSRLGIEEFLDVDPLTVFQGILWSTAGIPATDLVSNDGDASHWHYGAYRFVAIWLTDFRLYAYACDYNFLRDAIVNEEWTEYLYDDIVSISVDEAGSSLSMPTGVSVRSVQTLRITVTNSEFFVVTIGAPRKQSLRDEVQAPTDDVEKLLAAVRNKLRERKTSSDRREEGRFSSLL